MTPKTLLKFIDRIEHMICNLPSGIDEEADPDDTCPEDATAFQGGLAWQELQRMREYIKKENTNATPT